MNPEEFRTDESIERAGDETAEVLPNYAKPTITELADTRQFRQLLKSAREIKTLKESGEIDDTKYQSLKADLDRLSIDLMGYPAGKELTPDQAAEIMGPENFIGPDQVEATFGIELDRDQIPPVPFTGLELYEAKKAGQVLIYRAESDAKLNFLNTRRLDILSKRVAEKTGKGLTLDNVDWHKNENYYVNNRIYKPGWALVSTRVVSEPIGSDYYQQALAIKNYLVAQIEREGGELEGDAKEACAEFDEFTETVLSGLSPEEINKLLWEDRETLADQISELKINQQFRQSPVELMYDIMCYYHTTGKKMLTIDEYDNNHIVTNYCDNNINPVALSWYGETSLAFRAFAPGDGHDQLIVAPFQRRF